MNQFAGRKMTCIAAPDRYPDILRQRLPPQSPAGAGKLCSPSFKTLPRDP